MLLKIAVADAVGGVPATAGKGVMMLAAVRAATAASRAAAVVISPDPPPGLMVEKSVTAGRLAKLFV